MMSEKEFMYVHLDQIFYLLHPFKTAAAVRLNPPLSNAEIAAKTNALPFVLPEALYWLYEWRNGTDASQGDSQRIKAVAVMATGQRKPASAHMAGTQSYQYRFREAKKWITETRQEPNTDLGPVFQSPMTFSVPFVIGVVSECHRRMLKGLIPREEFIELQPLELVFFYQGLEFVLRRRKSFDGKDLAMSRFGNLK